MKNDKKIKQEVEKIAALSKEFLDLPNQCAYSDSIVSKIAEHAEILKRLHDTNKPDR